MTETKTKLSSTHKNKTMGKKKESTQKEQALELIKQRGFEEKGATYFYMNANGSYDYSDITLVEHAIRDKDHYFDCGRGYLWDAEHDVTHMGTIDYVEATYPDPTCDDVLNHMNKDMKEWFQSKWEDNAPSTSSNWYGFLVGAFTWDNTPEQQDFWHDVSKLKSIPQILIKMNEAMTGTTTSTPTPQEIELSGAQFLDKLPTLLYEEFKSCYESEFDDDSFLDYTHSTKPLKEHFELIYDNFCKYGEERIWRAVEETFDDVKGLRVGGYLYAAISDHSTFTKLEELCIKANISLEVPVSEIKKIGLEKVLTEEGYQHLINSAFTEVDKLVKSEEFLKKEVINTNFKIEGMDFQEITQKMSKRFAYSEEVASCLFTSYKSEEHVVLYGPGGHGKSEMSLEFFDSLGIKPFVQALGPGTTTEQLLGGMDMKLFNKTGEIQYLVENSFMNHEYVIFEEAFDAPVYVLTILKDILTSRELRNGHQVFPIKTKMIVICTNHSRSVIADDLSIKALMERFPLELEVKWQSYHEANYQTMFNIVFGSSTTVKDYNVISKLCGTLYSEGTTISPRTAVKMAKIYSTVGAAGLKFFADVPKSAYEELAKIEESSRKDAESLQVITSFEEDIKNFSDTFNSTTDPVDMLKLSKRLAKHKKALQSLVITETYYEHRDVLIQRCDELIEGCTKRAHELTEE
jgi:hypothetical protein